LLNDAEIAEYKRCLVELRGDLEELLRATEAGAKPVDLEAPFGRLSRIDAIQAQKLTQANRARTKVRLRHVMAALGAIRDDEYGDCRKCDDPISPERLAAVPESPLCLPCMEQLESGRR
jgi:DnaK suppressor protein